MPQIAENRKAFVAALQITCSARPGKNPFAKSRTPPDLRTLRRSGYTLYSRGGAKDYNRETMSLLALICSLPVALVGAYYLVNAGAVQWLGDLEGSHPNQVRVRLRRANGVVMLLVSLALYLGIARTFGRETDEPVSVLAPLAWVATLPLLMMMLVLAWLDMRLTRKLRRDLLRKAAMKDSKTSRSGGISLLALLAGPVLLLGLAGCDQTSAQTPRQSGQDPATRPATKPTTMRAEDGARPREGEPQQLRTVQMQLGNQKFVLQVADTDEERMYGLMFRKELAPDEGMIFVYPSDNWRSFWMKNTFIPLDIAFVNERGMVVNVEQMAAHDLNNTESTAPAKYAIELPLGAALRAGLKPGMSLQIPREARDAQDRDDE